LHFSAIEASIMTSGEETEKFTPKKRMTTIGRAMVATEESTRNAVEPIAPARIMKGVLCNPLKKRVSEAMPYRGLTIPS
jgi:hypothetical protein